MSKKLAVIAIAILSIPAAAMAVAAPKVFVCKFVGKPGVDERLQTGQNPISVSSNSIKDYQGVGSSFNDAQGHSLVIAEDTGQAEPTCPAGQTPPATPPTTPTPPIPTPVTPPTTKVPTPATPTEDTSNFVGK